MSPSLQQDLRQSKPFSSLQHEAYLSVVRTSSTLMDRVEDLLKPYGISATQYNVLRILRGAGQGGLCRNELRDANRSTRHSRGFAIASRPSIPM